MHTARFALAVAAAAGLFLTGCSDRDLRLSETHSEVAESRIAELERQLEEANAKNYTAAASRGDVKTGIEQDTNGVHYSTEAYAVHITIENSVLFKPGKAELSSQAKGVLARVVAMINDKYKDHEIQVVGHTDNQVISRSKDAWDDNWDLAGGRARVVLQHLHSKGVPYKQLSFAGYADQKPIASNGDEAGRAKNRRVEIVVIPRGAQAIDATDKAEAPAAKPKAKDKAKAKPAAADVAEGS